MGSKKTGAKAPDIFNLPNGVPPDVVMEFTALITSP